MAATLKAIETQYKGYRFRSRAEARLAVFLDSLGLAWDYEPEGYDLGDSGLYLPDFWLPEINSWIEIKGSAPTSAEQQKARALAIQSENAVYIFHGGMDPPNGGKKPYRTTQGMRALAYNVPHVFNPWTELPYPNLSFIWGECRGCSRVDVIGVSPDLTINKRICECKQQNVMGHGPRLKRAYDAGKSARFEHGQSGASR